MQKTTCCMTLIILNIKKRPTSKRQPVDQQFLGVSGRREDRLSVSGHSGAVGGNGNVLKLEWSGVCTTLKIHSNLLYGTFPVGEFYSMQIIHQ